MRYDAALVIWIVFCAFSGKRWILDVLGDGLKRESFVGIETESGFPVRMLRMVVMLRILLFDVADVVVVVRSICQIETQRANSLRRGQDGPRAPKGGRSAGNSVRTKLKRLSLRRDFSLFLERFFRRTFGRIAKRTGRG